MVVKESAQKQQNTTIGYGCAISETIEDVVSRDFETRFTKPKT